jgi:hypothetical protein
MDLTPYIPLVADIQSTKLSSYYGTLGDYIGGVWGTLISLLGFLAVVVTLWNSRKYEYRSKVYQVFVEMLRTHEDVVQSLSFNNRSGRDVFGEILEEFYQVHQILTREGHFSGVVDPIRKVQIAYLITYYGPQDATARLISDLKLHTNAMDIVKCIDKASARFEENNFLKELREQPSSDNATEASWRTEIAVVKALIKMEDFPARVRNILSKALNSASQRISPPKLDHLRARIKLIAARSHFPGHQNRLGHYFRNLYATYKYIDEAAIPRKERERLGRVVRSKLSNYEQAVLALNAITPLGLPWREGRKSLMQRYMPIRAVPKGFFGFDSSFVLHEIYTEVFFEWQELKVDN